MKRRHEQERFHAPGGGLRPPIDRAPKTTRGHGLTAGRLPQAAPLSALRLYRFRTSHPASPAAPARSMVRSPHSPSSSAARTAWGCAIKTLRDIMRHGFLFTLQRDTTVADACRMMATQNVGIVAVVDGERLCGVFSERDVVRRVVDRRLEPARTRLEEVMTSALVVADADEDYQSAMNKMDQANIRHLPVVSGNRLLSMLSIRDLMRVAIEDRGAEIEYLKEYLYQVPPSVAP
jgi:CBS domain-containing protein